MRMLYITGLPVPCPPGSSQVQMQLGEMATVAARVGLDYRAIDVFSGATERRGGLALKIRAGTLGAEYADRFDKMLTDVSGEGPFIVLAFSAGGWVFYTWLARELNLGRPVFELLQAAVVIGAPIENYTPTFDRSASEPLSPSTTEIDMPGGGQLTGLKAWRTDFASIVRGPGRSRINIVLSLSDRTVPPLMASPGRLSGIEGDVQLLQLRDCAHLALCADPTVLDFTEDSLRLAIRRRSQ